MKNYAQKFVDAMKNQKFANRKYPLLKTEREKLEKLATRLEQETLELQGHELENYNKIYDSE